MMSALTPCARIDECREHAKRQRYGDERRGAEQERGQTSATTTNSRTSLREVRDRPFDQRRAVVGLDDLDAAAAKCSSFSFTA
jgi:hypothetical protein